RATFTDGFHLKSGDDFDLHVGGRIEMDYRGIFDRPIDTAETGAPAKVLPDTFFLRELFLTLDGTIYQDFGFKLNMDFSPQGANSTTGPAGTAAIPENAWLEWKHFEFFRIQAGQFKSPNEVETLESPLFTEFISRSLTSRFVENQDMGVQIYGSLADSLFTYQIAYQDGRDITANSGRALNDDNDGKEWGARFTLAPFVTQADSPLSGLRVGVWGSYGREGNGGRQGGLETYSANGFQTTEFGISFVEFTNANYLLIGRRVREGAELTYTVGPFEVRGEWLQRRDEYQTTATAVAPFVDRVLPIHSYYLQATCIVTGETKIADARVTPKQNFEPWNGGWGALELGVRWAAVGVKRDRADDLVGGGDIIAAGNSTHVGALTIGENWWFTKNVKWAFNWIHEQFDEGVTFVDARTSNPAGTIRRHNMGGFLSQFQIDF
ncbi:MAG TPA: porin, partial [Planctomycetota bacterium]|nr:porin [Planctomycetota bacterium]